MSGPNKQSATTKNLKSQTSTTSQGIIDQAIDEAIDESFPASDSPAWTVNKKHRHAESSENHQEKITLTWERNTADFTYETYNRDAVLTFGGGESVTVSNPEKYFGDARFANSEELFVAALSFCYMHTFLAIASKQNYTITRYVDNAIAVLGKNAQGRICVAEIYLNPEILFEGQRPDNNQLLKLQDSAHHHCFIANSLNTKINITIQRIGA